MNSANNSVTAPALALAPPQQPHRPSTSCDRHPDELFTGFCPSCLFERLSVLDVTTKNAVASSSSYSKPPSSAAALKAIFKPSSSSGTGTSQQWVIPGLLLPELRRTKSLSTAKNEPFSLGAFEPQRRSCDVRVRNTLGSLFNEDAEHNTYTNESLTVDLTCCEIEIDCERRDSVVKSPVFEEESEIESEKDINFGNLKEPRSVIDEIVEEEETERVKVEEQMESNSQATKKPNRDFKEIAESLWSVASIFSKKLQKWRQKQKLKKHRSGGIGAGSSLLPVEKSIGRQLRDTQSEIAEYGYGRRSCDTDPRFSIDAGRFSLDAARISMDEPRYSFEEPRASWDRYLVGRTTAPPRIPSMLSVVEDSPIHRSNTHISVEEPSTPPQAPLMDELVPGGYAQTREYYTDSASRRRKSLDSCSSTKKISTSVMAEIEKLKLSASKDSNSLRDDCSVENFEMGVRENAGTKKSRRWRWNIFGLLHKKKENKYEEEGRRRSSVDRTISGLWNVETRKGFDLKMMRSNSSVSWRSSGNGGGGFHRKSVDGYVSGKKKVSNGREIENGMFKFNLTPSKGNRRGSSNSTGQTNRPVPNSQPLVRNFTNFY